MIECVNPFIVIHTKGEITLRQQSDIEIAQAASPDSITEIAAGIGIPERFVETYGRVKAKISLGYMADLADREDGALILVTAITPTPAGEGKTTTTVGLGDALRRVGKKSVVALREPSLGPVFGMKGGAAGGGYAQVIPMEDINLHFTGDLHAVSAANNLLAAMVDNHVYQGNALDIDTRSITWRRCMDINDRQLRNITDGLGGRTNGVPREDGFDITAASEVMAVLCLSKDMDELRENLGRIVVGYSRKGDPVTVGGLGAQGAMAALLRDALNPNLVQTLEHTPVFVHGGPFANIAHGCNSLAATRLALKLGDYAVTEAGFGADLGAEKFIDIKCRRGGLRPAAAVVVATVRALKMHGGLAKDALTAEDLGAVGRGMPNLYKHIENLTGVFGLPAVVAVNRFPSDTDAELALVRELCAGRGVKAVISDVWAQGGAGGEELAREVVGLCGKAGEPKYAYTLDMPVAEKIKAIATRVYGASSVSIAQAARKEIGRLEELGYGGLPVCIAKTQYSLSDNAALMGRPEGFTINVRAVRLSAGAQFIVALAGEIMTMPGLPKTPAACAVDVDTDGRIMGIF